MKLVQSAFILNYWDIKVKVHADLNNYLCVSRLKRCYPIYDYHDFYSILIIALKFKKITFGRQDIEIEN